ncbi:MAG: cell division protein FtsW [Alphaproteobacteria bacterium]|nr:cell division protein FtsW [Alphaproteobacteria bacterium]
MATFSRLSRSRIANWWWTVDKLTLALILLIIFIGAFLVFSASPAVARTNNFSDYHFIKKQIVFIFAALLILFSTSMMRLKNIRRLAILGYIAFFILTIFTLFAGYQTKGASRWIRIFGLTLQPSEFIKPTFIVVSAWLLEGSKKFEDFPGGLLSAGLFLVTCAILISQPDFGSTIFVSCIWGFQLFLAGIPLVLITVLGCIGILGGIGAYFTLGHVHDRVQQFLFSGGEMSYQVKKSMEAFENGNLLGRGPGEGVVKLHLPDAHTDFIFAVAGEEFGVWLCLLLIILFAVIVLRGLRLSLKDNNLFIIYAAAGLSAAFGLQGIINMASTLYLIPTKGMTLPFISYGGSSIFASALSMGMLLALTRRNVSAEDKDF